MYAYNDALPYGDQMSVTVGGRPGTSKSKRSTAFARESISPPER